MQIAFLPRYCTLASSVSVALYFSFFRVTGRHHNITVLLAFLKCAKSHSSFVAQQNLWPHKVNSHGDGGRETVFTILNNRKVYRWGGLDRSDLKPFQCPKTNEVFPIWIMSNIILSFITKHCQCCHSNLCHSSAWNTMLAHVHTTNVLCFFEDNQFLLFLWQEGRRLLQEIEHKSDCFLRVVYFY